MATKKLDRVVIGTRPSPLALRQAELVQEALLRADSSLAIKISPIRTTGDKLKTGSLAEVGGKGLFVKEIEEALIAGTIDIAVHSLKDMPTDLPKGLALGAFLPREDPRDLFISKKYPTLLDLPRGAVVGTGSLRRQAQLKNFRPDLKVTPLRGNVETRLRKVEAGECDALILAVAGLKRLGKHGSIQEFLPTTLMLPAVGQGAIAVEIRRPDDPARSDDPVQSIVHSLNDHETAVCVRAEDRKSVV